MLKKIIYKLYAAFKFSIYKIQYSNKFSSTGFSFLSISSIFHIRNKGFIKIGKNLYLDKFSELKSENGIISIGDNFYMNKYSRVISMSRISIGSNVTIAQFVSILDHDHNYQINKNKSLSKNGYIVDQIEIGNNVFIGDKCTVLKGVKIGDNVKIAANSLVNKNIQSNSVYGGVPAQLLKKL